MYCHVEKVIRSIFGTVHICRVGIENRLEKGINLIVRRWCYALFWTTWMILYTYYFISGLSFPFLPLWCSKCIGKWDFFSSFVSLFYSLSAVMILYRSSKIPICCCIWLSFLFHFYEKGSREVDIFISTFYIMCIHCYLNCNTVYS